MNDGRVSDVADAMKVDAAGLASMSEGTSTDRMLIEINLAEALSRSSSIGTFWAISVRPPDPQIIDFAHLSGPTPGALDK